MKTNRKLRKAAGVLLIVMFASGALAATIILVDTDFMRSTESTVLPYKISDFDPKLFRFLDLDLFRLKGPEEPIPTPALLILVGLIALIALTGRRR